MRSCGVVLVLLGCWGAVVEAQEAVDEALVALFFDCQAPGCRDLDYLRRRAPFVNWVRDREASDVHVLVTSQVTGGGGRQFMLDFIGVGAFEGEDLELIHTTAGDATVDEQREGISDVLRLGLVRYVLGTPAAEQLRVRLVSEGTASDPLGPGGRATGREPSAQEDPWDFWTFRLNVNGFLNGEASFRSSNTFGSLQADRTTDAWKINLRSNFSRNVQEFDVIQDDSLRTIREAREDWGLEGALVRSVEGQWALGIRADVGSSTFLNQNFRFSIMPGVEYNFVPYSESSRRAFTLQYLVGPTHYAYTETTIFGFDSETRAQQTLTGRISLVEPWGRWSTSVSGAQYLHDGTKYSVGISGNVNVRLFRGFSIRVSGNYSWIRDQLQISGSTLTEEEVLLRQRQLETSFRYFTSFGVEYRFGSIFNNVVNPRFGGGGGGEIFFF